MSCRIYFYILANGAEGASKISFEKRVRPKSLYCLQGSHSYWKTWKMGRHFPVWEKSGNFEQTRKVRENHTKKTGKVRGNSHILSIAMPISL